MDFGIISTRYAKALLRFALENGEAERVYREMERTAAAFENVAELQNALLNPVLGVKQKEALLACAASEADESGKGNSNLSESTRRFVSLVVESGRADMMLFIAHSYGTLYRRREHIVRGKLIVPVAINAELEQKIRKTVEARTDCKVDFNVEERPEIEGGFILEYDTYRLDASVRTQLEKVKRALIS